MVLSTGRELMYMPTKTHTQDGGCLAKSMERALILTTKLGPSWSENGLKIKS